MIGGGASGAHAAVRLTDFGQDVVLIEKQSDLVNSRRDTLGNEVILTQLD